uniref:dihydrofolate reductase n=1 Tax=uncultured Bacillota bacterium TaxID=344338 RepID=A0A650EPG9_9FIRM|nr:dihydrofolate reductase [uncultured Firmicutes bacterium]
MNIIVAVDENWGIGKSGGLLDHIPEDMKFFREKTKGKTVIMGRKTLLSFPNGKPLPNRTNIVITTDKEFKREGVIVCHDLPSAIQTAKEYADEKDIFFIGGARVYNEAEEYCDTAYITKIEKNYDADVSIKNFDLLPQWKVAEENEITTAAGLKLRFCTYRK